MPVIASHKSAKNKNNNLGTTVLHHGNKRKNEQLVIKNRSQPKFAQRNATIGIGSQEVGCCVANVVEI